MYLQPIFIFDIFQIHFKVAILLYYVKTETNFLLRIYSNMMQHAILTFLIKDADIISVYLYRWFFDILGVDMSHFTLHGGISFNFLYGIIGKLRDMC